MKLFRFCLLAIAFVTFPLALITLADVTLVERELPELLGDAARETATNPTTQAELVEELTALWLDESPGLAGQLIAVGLEPEATLEEVFTALVESESFADELDRGVTQFGEDLVAGRRPVLELDFQQAIDESRAGFDPTVVSVVQQHSTVKVAPLTDEEALDLQQGASTVKLYALFATAISALLLALLTLSIRHHVGSLFLVGMPTLFLQRALLNSLAGDPDPIDAEVGSLIAETFMPWTVRMMIVAGSALVIYLASYKLLPPRGTSAVPYAKDIKSLPPQPSPREIRHSLLGYEDDHQSLRELSIVED